MLLSEKNQNIFILRYYYKKYCDMKCSGKTNFFFPAREEQFQEKEQRRGRDPEG